MTISPWPYAPWITDVPRREAHRFGPELTAPPSGAVWFSSGDPAGSMSALLVAQRCNRMARQPHFVWDPVEGEVIQMTPVTHSCRLFRSESPARGLLAVLVVTDAAPTLKPGESPSETALGPLFAGLGIPAEWPAGPPRIGGPRVVPIQPGHYLATQLEPDGRRP